LKSISIEMVSQEDNQSVANELDSKIVQQIEYYFSDINLSKDKFMKDLLTKDDGWITFDTLMTFNRLKSLSDDKSVVVKALEKCDKSLLEISECLNKIRRPLNRPLPQFDDNYTQNLNERTLHLKGFPAETKLDDVMTFCRQFGAVENIEMRRHFKTKKFKGCIFVTYVDKEVAQKVIDSQEVKYEDKDLLRENKVNYFLRKKEFSEKKNSKKNSAKDKSLKTETKSENIDTKEEEEEGDDNEANDKSHTPVRYEGAVLRLRGLDDNTKFPDIKKLFQEFGHVAYVEDVKQNESFVRFDGKEGAKNALEKAKTAQNAECEPKFEINGKEITVELLTGEDELQYWTQFEKTRADNIKKKIQKKKAFFGQKGKMWQRGRKRGYKGSGDRNGKRSKNEDSD